VRPPLELAAAAGRTAMRGFKRDFQCGSRIEKATFVSFAIASPIGIPAAVALNLQ
jgi:hypothetical protein